MPNVKKKSDKVSVYLKHPKFYDDFHCIGGSCPYSCCCGKWGIIWRENEIDKVLNAENCSEELREAVKAAFVPTEKNPKLYAVVYNEKHECPLMTEDKMCRIQRELGAEYLSYTCRVYPRKELISGTYAFRTMVMSCPEVLRLICDNEDSMEIVVSKTKMQKVNECYDTDSSIAMHPELKYRASIFNFYHDIISDKSRSLEDSLILGAIAAKSLSKCIEDKRYEHIPILIEELKEQIKKQSNLDMIAGIKPNYTYKIGVCAKIVEFGANPYVMKKIYNEDGSIDVRKYLESNIMFEAWQETKPYVLRNIALNMLFECCMPFFHADISLFDNYRYYLAAFAAIKTLGAVSSIIDENIDTSFKLSVSFVSRTLFQTRNNVDKMLELLDKFKCTSVAALGLLLK